MEQCHEALLCFSLVVKREKDLLFFQSKIIQSLPIGATRREGCWKLKRCLGFRLNGDGADEQSFFSRRSNRGRGTNNSHPDVLLGSFNFLLSLGGEAGENCILLEIARVTRDSGGKSYNLFLLELGKIVGNSIGNSNDSEDGSFKRFLCLGFSLNGDGADEQRFFSRRSNRGRGTTSNSLPDALLWIFNFLSLGGEVGSSCILLETARVMQVSGGNADDEILVICAGKMKSSNEVVDNRMDLSTSLISVILFYFL